MNGTDCDNLGTATETWSFFSDGDGVRVKEVHLVGTTSTTRLFLFGGSYEVENPGANETDNPFGIIWSFASPNIHDQGGESLAFSQTNTKCSSYYSIAGMRVAMRDDDNPEGIVGSLASPNVHNRVGESAAFSQANACVRSYYFAKTPTEWPFDHLSSASVVMDSTGGVITNQRFMPFGELRQISRLTR